MEEVINVTNKTPIEIALKIDDEGFTTAKNLYEWLELNPSNYAKWARANILENQFAEENVDYFSFVPEYERKNPNPTTDYKISATLAKKLCMISKSIKGDEARNYFIGCEQTLKKVLEQKLQTALERAKGIAVRQALTKAIQQSGEKRTYAWPRILYLH